MGWIRRRPGAGHHVRARPRTPGVCARRAAASPGRAVASRHARRRPSPAAPHSRRQRSCTAPATAWCITGMPDDLAERSRPPTGSHPGDLGESRTGAGLHRSAAGPGHPRHVRRRDPGDRAYTPADGASSRCTCAGSGGHHGVDAACYVSLGGGAPLRDAAGHPRPSGVIPTGCSQLPSGENYPRPQEPAPRPEPQHGLREARAGGDCWDRARDRDDARRHPAPGLRLLRVQTRRPTWFDAAPRRGVQRARPRRHGRRARRPAGRCRRLREHDAGAAGTAWASRCPTSARPPPRRHGRGAGHPQPQPQRSGGSRSRSAGAGTAAWASARPAYAVEGRSRGARKLADGQAGRGDD